MHFYKHNVGDYRRDTTHLTLLEHGVYRQLLDTYYLSEEPISSDLTQVCRKLMARTDEERAAVESVLNEFFELTERGYEHSRCEAELSEYRDFAEAGRRGAQKRWGGYRNPNGGANGEANGGATETPMAPPMPTINQKPETINHKPKARAKKIAEPVEVGAGFDLFWSEYPRKVNKSEAQRSWVALSPDDSLIETILSALAKYKLTDQWRRDNGAFIPFPTTWLNQRRWEDEVVVTVEPWEADMQGMV